MVKVLFAVVVVVEFLIVIVFQVAVLKVTNVTTVFGTLEEISAVLKDVAVVLLYQ